MWIAGSLFVIGLRRLGRTSVEIPVIGLGTWEMGGSYAPDYSRDREVIEVIRYAVGRDVRLIDTAEMYGGGHTEELVGEAVREFREEVFIATKVWVSHLRYEDVFKALEGSLRRLGTDYVDLYQVHWPNPGVPLRETMKAMEKLALEGKIRFIGVCNFYVPELEEAMTYLSHFDIVSNQVLYNVRDRGVEEKILPYCRKNGITVMAYRPLAKGAILREPYRGKLEEIAVKYGKTVVQVALNWVLRHDHVVAIPKTSNPRHLDEILGAVGWRMSDKDYERISEMFRV